MRKRIVLLEGIPGSGKSTLARFLAVQLARNGQPSVLLHETTADHPIVFLDAIPGVEDWMNEYRRRWTAFLSSDSDPAAVYVMESSLLQFPILSLLNRDLDRRAIRDFVNEIETQLGEHDAQIVFLNPEDPEAAIREMMRSRGGDELLKRKYEQYRDESFYRNRGQTGPELHLIFLAEYAKLARELAERTKLRTLAIEYSIPRDWSSYERLLLEKFGLTHCPDPSVEEERLQRYAGTYRNGEMNVDIAVECREGKLFIFGDRLLKCFSENVFYIDDMSVKVAFEDRRIVIGEKDLFANRRDEGTSFERIAQ